MKSNHKLTLAFLSVFAFLLPSCTRNTVSTGSSKNTPSEKSEASENKKSETIKTYSVSAKEDSSYTLQYDHQDGKYKAGETVNLTLTLKDDKKEFDGFRCEQNLTFENIQTENNITKATFVMPEKDVVISVSLKDKTYRIQKINNYSETLFETVSLKENDAYKEGEEVTLTISSSGLNFVKSSIENYYIEIDSTMYHPSFEEAYVSSFSILFTMPSHDITINLSYGLNSIDNQNGYKVSLEENEYVSLLAYDPNQKYTRFYGQLLRKAGYKVDKIEYKYGDGNWQTNFTTFDISNLCSLYISGISADVTIRVQGTYTGVKKITYVNEEAIIPTSGKLYAEATQGDKYSLSFKNSPSHTLTGKPTFEGVEVDDNDVTTTYFKLYVGENDITITFPAKANGKITIKENEDILSTRIYNRTSKVDSEYCAPNATFAVYPLCKDGKVVTSARTIDKDQNKSSYSYPEEDSYGNLYIDLRMPGDGDCQVEFNTADGILITSEASENGNLVLTRNTYRKGDKVNFTATPVSVYYQFEKLIDVKTGQQIQVTMNGTNGYFTMPDVKELTIKAIFGEKEKAEVTLEGFDSEFKDFKATGSLSKEELTGTKTTASFLVGETITITVSLKENSDKTLAVYKTVDGVETEIEKGTFYYTLQVEKGLSKIRIEAKENAPESKGYKATIIKPEDCIVNYVINYGSPVSDLDGKLIPGEDGSVVLQINVTSTVDGKVFEPHVYDSTGKELQSEGFITKKYIVKSDIRIEIVEA
mgnify:FL=1